MAIIDSYIPIIRNGSSAEFEKLVSSSMEPADCEMVLDMRPQISANELVCLLNAKASTIVRRNYRFIAKALEHEKADLSVVYTAIHRIDFAATNVPAEELPGTKMLETILKRFDHEEIVYLWLVLHSRSQAVAAKASEILKVRMRNLDLNKTTARSGYSADMNYVLANIQKEMINDVLRDLFSEKISSNDIKPILKNLSMWPTLSAQVIDHLNAAADKETQEVFHAYVMERFERIEKEGYPPIGEVSTTAPEKQNDIAEKAVQKVGSFFTVGEWIIVAVFVVLSLYSHKSVKQDEANRQFNAQRIQELSQLREQAGEMCKLKIDYKRK